MGRQVPSSAHHPALAGGCCLHQEPAARGGACGDPASLCHKHVPPSVLLGTSPRMTSPLPHRWLPVLIPDLFPGSEPLIPPSHPGCSLVCMSPPCHPAPTFTMCLLVSPTTQAPCRTPAPLTLRNRPRGSQQQRAAAAGAPAPLPPRPPGPGAGSGHPCVRAQPQPGHTHPLCMQRAPGTAGIATSLPGCGGTAFPKRRW
ncbi:cbp/p300-interacting transactivator 4-like [Neopsephotus bourkii]|uniref:cbp/p300-interacting transactivator 4-like n=1 Tax=Neopsephotus bourkii TaxID=309878 RepID=UPI002AA597DD|nr:cbp/p300-interacting transactivator 4-like [Neopsephotus bourkii]XP_061229101.1 cbp/p300-interacting transactivator 4-like [Neopsephotus bourkii]